MKRTFALLLALTLSRPGYAEDLLRQSLVQLRGHVRFVDVSREGRLMNTGENLMTAGMLGVTRSPEFVDLDDDDDALKVAAILMLSSLAIWGIGGAIKVSGQMMKNAKPPPQLRTECTTHYMTAKGLNQFMGFDVDAQYEFAAKEPELSAFLIKLNDAYNLIKYYRLVKPQH